MCFALSAKLDSCLNCYCTMCSSLSVIRSIFFLSFSANSHSSRPQFMHMNSSHLERFSLSGETTLMFEWLCFVFAPICSIVFYSIHSNWNTSMTRKKNVQFITTRDIPRTIGNYYWFQRKHGSQFAPVHLLCRCNSKFALFTNDNTISMTKSRVIRASS